MPDATRWRTRTKELRYVKPGELADHPLQHRLHAPEQRAHLVGILDEIGIAGGLLAWYSARNGGALTAIDGHLRKSLDQDQPWPTIITDLDDREADLLLLAYDWIGAQAQSGKDELQRLLGQVQPQTAAVQQLQATIAEQAGLPWGPQGPDGAGQAAPDPRLDEIDALRDKWQTAPGQLWLIPSVSLPGQAHRLLCGDSTQAADVKRLMAGERAVLFATDPPYLVDYDGTNHPHKWGVPEPPTKNKDWSETYHDWDQAADNPDLYNGFIAQAVAHAIVEDAAWYCWHASRNQAHVEHVWEAHGAFVHQQIVWVKDGAFVHQQIVWVKDRPILTRSWYMWQHEPCFFGWIKGKKPKRVADDYPPTVWSLPTILPGTSTLHPTQKPVEVFARPMRQHTARGDLCYEPFGGSGTQLVAAEQLGRRCYVMEREAGFLAVMLQRAQDLGLEPRLEDA